MYSRNRLSSYVDPAVLESSEVGRGSASRRRNGGESSDDDREPHLHGPGGDAVANYNKYKQNLPSNPRNSPVRRSRASRPSGIGSSSNNNSSSGYANGTGRNEKGHRDGGQRRQHRDSGAYHPPSPSTHRIQWAGEPPSPGRHHSHHSRHSRPSRHDHDDSHQRRRSPRSGGGSGAYAPPSPSRQQQRQYSSARRGGGGRPRDADSIYRPPHPQRDARTQTPPLLMDRPHRSADRHGHRHSTRSSNPPRGDSPRRRSPRQSIASAPRPSPRRNYGSSYNNNSSADPYPQQQQQQQPRLTNGDDRRSSRSPRGQQQPHVHTGRDAGLVATPAQRPRDELDDDSFDDYISPARGRNGRYSVGGGQSPRTRHPQQQQQHRSAPRGGGSSSAARAPQYPAIEAPPGAEQSRFLVRVHRVVGAFGDFEEAKRAAPTTYLALHTTEERGRSGVVTRQYNPVFNDEFLFSSSRPEKDALVVSLVASAGGAGRDKRVAEAVVSLQNLPVGVERERWVSLVRRPGTADAYQRGEVLISVISQDYPGPALRPSEEDEAAWHDEVYGLLKEYAPEELHRLEWFLGNVAREGPQGLARLRARLAERAVEPVRLRVTVEEVSGLTAADGSPSLAETCYVVLRTRKGSEVSTKTVPYRKRAVIGQTFVVVLRNPEVDAVSLTVYSAGRRFGEALVGLTNLQAGVAKELSVMVVRAAETGDATPAGEMRLTLQTDGYSSPYRMSAEREAQLRERVLAYLWAYLRDDLHRLDAIVAGIDDEDLYMREWSRAVGPERRQRHASLRIRSVRNAFGTDGSALPTGSKRCYMRVTVGPQVYRTELATLRGDGELAFKTPIDFNVYDPKTDAIELMLIEDGGVEREVGRVVLGTAGLPHGEEAWRHVRLVTRPLTRSASLQGEVEVALHAHDFGLPLEEALSGDRHRYLCERLEAATLRGDATELHRVPFIIDTAPPGEAEAVVEKQTKVQGGDVAAAPMTVCVIGLRNMTGGTDSCYVKVYLNGRAILRTRDRSGGADIMFDVGDDHERTVQVADASQTKLFFKVGQHQSCIGSTVVARTELALRTMVRGEKNIVWIPLFAGSAEHSNGRAAAAGAPAASAGANGAAGAAGAQENATATANNNNNNNTTTANVADEEAFRGNKMSTPAAATATAAATAAVVPPVPLGQLGVMVQSNAFPGTVVTEYGSGAGRVKRDDGAASGGTAIGHSPAAASAYEAVTQDVSSLLIKYQPQELAKVQPLIAECSALKEAHSELRARFCPRDVGATVYVHVDKVELATPDGQGQEERCGVAVGVNYGDDAELCRKTEEFPNDVTRRRAGYTPARLDISEFGDGALSSFQRPRGGAGAASVQSGGGSVLTAPPLEIKLLLVPGSSPAAAGGGAGTRNSSVMDVGGGAAQDGASPRRSSLGGQNNLQNYMADGQAGVPPAPAPRAESAADDRHRRSRVLPNELGRAELSLRALVSPPLYEIGKPIRVPIVRGRGGAGVAAAVVGHVTLHLSLPTFATPPPWLRLASRTALAEVVPDYVHYYERRIGAYLREKDPAELADLHYKLHERDVASGSWPYSLPDWLDALVKRCGAETTNRFGREPSLPFDAEARAAARARDAQLSQQEEQQNGGRRGRNGGGRKSSVFAPESDNIAWIGADDEGFFSDVYAGGRGGASDIYEVSASAASRRAGQNGDSRQQRSTRGSGVWASDNVQSQQRSHRNSTAATGAHRKSTHGEEVEAPYGF